MLDSMEHQ